MTESVTSDRDYLEIASDNNGSNILVSATTIGGSIDGVIPQTIAQGSYSGSTSVTHNLLTIPVVRAFYDSDKNGKLYNTTRFDNGGAYLSYVSAPQLLTVSTTLATKFVINAFSSVSDVPVFYRIYNFGTKGFTSGSRIDKIFHKGTSSKTVGAAPNSDTPVLATDTLPHGQGEQIFWTLQFSTDQTNWYREGTPLFGAADTTSGPPGGPYARYFYHVAYGYADATNFYVNYVHNYGTSQTIYVRFVQDYIT